MKNAERNRKKGRISFFGTLAVLVSSAFLAALSIVFGKYLAIPIGDIMRFSFESLPIMMAGVAFGPLVGGAVGIVADLVGSVMRGYDINLAVTAGAFAIGVISGTVYSILDKLEKAPFWLKIAATVSLSHIIGSVIIKTFGLAVFYGIPIPTLMLWRLLNYVIVGICDGLVLWYLLKSRLIRAQINSILKRKKFPADEKKEKKGNEL